MVMKTVWWEKEKDPLRLEEEHDKDEEDMEPATEEESVVNGPRTLEEEVMDLTEPIETRTIYLARPLRQRTTSAVLLAARECLLQLRQSGLHVGAIHTDRGSGVWVQDIQGLGHRK